MNEDLEQSVMKVRERRQLDIKGDKGRSRTDQRLAPRYES